MLGPSVGAIKRFSDDVVMVSSQPLSSRAAKISPPSGRGGRSQTTLWVITSSLDEESKNDHGTQKPVELMRRPIQNHTVPGQSVYDPFIGSGTSIIAAETCGRVCYGIEIVPGYVDIAVKRWQDFTGKPARLDGDGRTFEEISAERNKAR